MFRPKALCILLVVATACLQGACSQLPPNNYGHESINESGCILRLEVTKHYEGWTAVLVRVGSLVYKRDQRWDAFKQWDRAEVTNGRVEFSLWEREFQPFVLRSESADSPNILSIAPPSKLEFCDAWSAGSLQTKDDWLRHADEGQNCYGEIWLIQPELAESLPWLSGNKTVQKTVLLEARHMQSLLSTLPKNSLTVDSRTGKGVHIYQEQDLVGDAQVLAVLPEVMGRVQFVSDSDVIRIDSAGNIGGKLSIIVQKKSTSHAATIAPQAKVLH